MRYGEARRERDYQLQNFGVCFVVTVEAADPKVASGRGRDAETVDSRQLGSPDATSRDARFNDCFAALVLHLDTAALRIGYSRQVFKRAHLLPVRFQNHIAYCQSCPLERAPFDHRVNLQSPTHHDLSGAVCNVHQTRAYDQQAQQPGCTEVINDITHKIERKEEGRALEPLDAD
jgi:hypothetical protein